MSSAAPKQHCSVENKSQKQRQTFLNRCINKMTQISPRTFAKVNTVQRMNNTNQDNRSSQSNRETSLPNVLETCSRNIEWVCYFLLSQSGKTIPSFCCEGQQRSSCAPSESLLLSDLDHMDSIVVMSHELSKQATLEKCCMFCSVELFKRTRLK